MASEGSGVDAVVLTAIELEYRAVLEVSAGAEPESRWVEERRKGLPVAFRTFEGTGGRPLRVAVARGSGMGMTETMAVLVSLVDELAPHCIAMCGVCAGRPGKTALGDVIAAERLFAHDTGKQLPGGVQRDLETYNLRRDWRIELERFDPTRHFGTEAWWRARPLPYEWQENWVLCKLLDNVKDPSALPESEHLCPQWGKVIEALWARGDLKQSELKLTVRGRERIKKALIVHKNALPDLSSTGSVMPFKLHVAPMGSGNKVVEDESVWGFVSEAMRKTLGLEMEGAALGLLAELRKHTATLDALVMKGVMDFANHGRDDHFKAYAARASAECLLAFLRERLPEAAPLELAGGVPSSRPEASGPLSAPDLPPAPRPFLGRGELLDELCAKLLRSPAPAVALLGPGGIGKSALTLSALHHPKIFACFGKRRWFVRVDTARSAEAMLPLIADALGLHIHPQQPPRTAICAFLAREAGVLALDGLEIPWREQQREVEELLLALKVAGELALVVSVRGKQRPAGLDAEAIEVPQLDRDAAAELFCRIARADRDDPSLAPLLEPLDGVPLAITLLAHPAEGESLANLRNEWEQKRTELLAREGAEPGRETCWAASMAVSINSRQMTDGAKRLLALLGRLPNGVAIEDLDAVLPGGGREAKRRLVQAGLAYDAQGRDRVRMLAPVREHVRAKLPPARNDLAAVLTHYALLASALGPCVGAAEGAKAIKRLAPETANIDAMFREGLAGDEPGPWVDASVALTNFARFSGHSSPSPLDAALEVACKLRDTGRQAACLYSLGEIALGRSAHIEARRCYHDARTLYGEAGDLLGEAHCFRGLGDLALHLWKHAKAYRCYKRALALYRKAGDVQGEANCIKGLGHIARRGSKNGEARPCYEQARSLYEKVGHALGAASCIKNLGHVARERSDLREARRCYEQARSLYEKVGHALGAASCIKGLGHIARDRCRHDEARRHYDEARPQFREVGAILCEADCLFNLGDLALGGPGEGEASRLYAEAKLLIDRTDDKRSEANYYLGLGKIERMCRDYAEARGHFDRALSLFREVGAVRREADCIVELGELASARSDSAGAAERYEKALEIYERIGDPHPMGATHRRLARLATDAAKRQAYVEAARELWAKIDCLDRPDLVAELDAEFDGAPPAVVAEPGSPSVRPARDAEKANGAARPKRRPARVPRRKHAAAAVAAPEERPATPCRILFLSSNPDAARRLDVGTELRNVRDEIKLSGRSHLFELESWPALHFDDLRRSLNEFRPSVVHFGGHGAGAAGLLLHEGANGSRLVKAEDLRQLFALAADHVCLVVLNACYSAEQASALVEVVGCVVGMEHAVGDVAACRFAAAFYGALASGRSVRNAFDQGRLTMAFGDADGGRGGAPGARDLGPLSRPGAEASGGDGAARLLVRPGIDADALYLVPPPAR
jgi:tetratricopeptide (TPR) repeat protein/nucleoside phosphorylase